MCGGSRSHHAPRCLLSRPIGVSIMGATIATVLILPPVHSQPQIPGKALIRPCSAPADSVPSPPACSYCRYAVFNDNAAPSCCPVSTFPLSSS